MLAEDVCLCLKEENMEETNRIEFNPNRSLDFGEIACLCPQHASGLAEGVAGYVEA